MKKFIFIFIAIMLLFSSCSSITSIDMRISGEEKILIVENK